jgi:transposase
MRKKYSAKLKAKMAVAMIRERETVAELSQKYEIHRTMLSKWKKQALDELPVLFSSNKKFNKNDDENLINELYKQIGQLKVENDWLKKKVDTVGS